MFGESVIKLKTKLLQGIRVKFFLVFISSILFSTICIIVFQSLVGNIYGDVARFEEEYSFIYFVIFLILTSLFFLLLSKNMMKRLEQINQGVNQISKGNLEVHIPTIKNDEIGELATNINGMVENLNESIEKEKKSQEMKNEMIHNISHDLRTPVTSLIGYVDLVESKLHSNIEECDQYVAVLKRKSYELKNQIDDLLEYCHINYKEIQLYKEIVEVKPLIEQIMIDFVPQLDEEKMHFDIECKQTVQIEVDMKLMIRLMQNVISNSILYGKSGKKIVIEMLVENMNVQIKIKNYGQCISSKDLPYLFEKFYRGEKSRNAHTGGKGMGLAIAKSIAQIHEGDITVCSSNKETTFTIILPVYKKES
ncbi:MULTISPECIES: sensor histidine kinase [Bacillus cereus group]|uniref:histidine kinase n=4 Tax=Bacillus pseudomycoides TaxID=64104 RepID=A0AAJ2DQE5_9BACI|nr:MULTISPECIES: HAMP domain-containing sensor histidine kinase [Bacillus cereus group]MBJ8031814.1 HAMP domain-containing histidine kinase [Bacillus cereus group sp. N21]MCR8860082.1 HAMP domain-containing histidine kinase [Bacillus pseudomycoides]MDR4185815.1 HAMP domain-containing histidine kinase [Bacillus pseudomycoides]MDR4329488.1 HAMP domain-containing histidine kinase [Bacillus pseudomycoides]MED0856039.1 HAMP domain-containing sensor histidine kinase [Bacillus pseudomycoides]